MQSIIASLEAKFVAQNETQNRLLLELTHALKKKLSTDSKIPLNINFISPKMPFTTISDVDKFENDLKNESFFEQMVRICQEIRP